MSRMGYTHYLKFARKPTDAELKPAIAEMKKVVADGRAKRVLFGPLGKGVPKIRATELAFNGNAKGDRGHETFSFPGDLTVKDYLASGPGFFDFCKTARKPYDAYVVACLLVARDHFPKKVLDITSDGEAGDWLRPASSDYTESGVDVYRRVLGREPKLTEIFEPDVEDFKEDE